MKFKFIKQLSRKANPVNWHQLRSVYPISDKFGLDRGTPVDRYYIENFLAAQKHHITGHVLEIAECVYSKKFGQHVEAYEILHTKEAKGVTIIGDLTATNTLPENKIDCFICTQTFNFIYDIKSAIAGAYHLLKPGGVLLATLAGISQISRYDMDRWGDYWRFTDKSARMAFEEVFGQGNVNVQTFGNVLSSVAFLEGITVEDLTSEELDFQDPNYQLTITAIAKKRGA